MSIRNGWQRLPLRARLTPAGARRRHERIARRAARAARIILRSNLDPLGVADEPQIVTPAHNAWSRLKKAVGLG